MKKFAIKNFIFFISVILISCISSKSIRAQDRVVIGEIRNGRPIITMDLELVKYNLEYFLKKNKIEENLTSFEIISEGEFYGLYAINFETTFKIFIELELENNKFYQSMSAGNSTFTVSCSGCALGCHVKWKANQWVCWPLCDPCTKTETVTTQQIFFEGKASY